MRMAKFYLDCLPNDEWVGFTEGDTWNGFACPYFSFNEGLRLHAALVALATAEGELESDAFDLNWTPDEWGQGVHKGQIVFAIGSHNWTWSEIEVES